jgi:hypothetical protein
MFFPLCFLAPSLFSYELLLRLIPMKENIAPLEENKTGDGNERDEGDGEGMLVGPSVFSSVYVLSFCLSLLCYSLSVCFSGFLSRASPISPSVFYVFLPISLFLCPPSCFFVHPSFHSRPSCL